jgi:lipid A 4'-phosphatase
MKGLAVYAAALAASVALFLLLPGIDTWVSGWFYDPQHGFTLAGWPPLRGLENSIRWIVWAIVLLTASGAVWLRLTGRPLWRFDRNMLIFIVAATALGPGIIVNTVLKDHWGRARPYQIEAFGGTKSFTAAPLPADQCARNCSFVSGHAALAFSLVSFAFLLPAGQRRDVAAGAAIGFGALVGLARIAAGHHFLSDVVYAGLITVATTWLLHRWLVVHDGATPIIAAIDRLSETKSGRRVLWVGGFALVEAISMIWIDQPLAALFHRDIGLKPLGEMIQRFGIGYPYLVLSGLAFAAMYWGGRWHRLRPWDPALRAAAAFPAFFFAAIAASGLTVDLLKIVVGRTRPKLLFADGIYDFGWFGLRADDWSWPSGHAATAAAVVTALWCLWPRPLYLYVAAAALVAFSRVVTGAHYLSDVIAGAAIAVVVTRGVAFWLTPRQRVTKGQLAGKAEPDAAPDYRAV